MKIKELIALDSINLLKLYLKEQGIGNVNDLEASAIFNICKKNDFSLFTTSLENGGLYRINTREIILYDDFILEENNYDCVYETLSDFLNTMLCFSGELCSDLYDMRDNSNEWVSYFAAHNHMLDCITKFKESKQDFIYTIDLYMSKQSQTFKKSIESFTSAIECNQFVYNSVINFIKMHQCSNLKESENLYDLSDKSELNKFLFELVEKDYILLWAGAFRLEVKITTQALTI